MVDATYTVIGRVLYRLKTTRSIVGMKSIMVKRIQVGEGLLAVLLDFSDFTPF